MRTECGDSVTLNKEKNLRAQSWYDIVFTRLAHWNRPGDQNKMNYWMNKPTSDTQRALDNFGHTRQSHLQALLVFKVLDLRMCDDDDDTPSHSVINNNFLPVDIAQSSRMQLEDWHVSHKLSWHD